MVGEQKLQPRLMEYVLRMYVRLFTSCRNNFQRIKLKMKIGTEHTGRINRQERSRRRTRAVALMPSFLFAFSFPSLSPFFFFSLALSQGGGKQALQASMDEKAGKKFLGSNATERRCGGPGKELTGQCGVLAKNARRLWTKRNARVFFLVLFPLSLPLGSGWLAHVGKQPSVLPHHQATWYY